MRLLVERRSGRHLLLMEAWGRLLFRSPTVSSLYRSTLGFPPRLSTTHRALTVAHDGFRSPQEKLAMLHTLRSARASRSQVNLMRSEAQVQLTLTLRQIRPNSVGWLLPNMSPRPIRA